MLFQHCGIDCMVRTGLARKDLVVVEAVAEVEAEVGSGGSLRTADQCNQEGTESETFFNLFFALGF